MPPIHLAYHTFIPHLSHIHSTFVPHSSPIYPTFITYSFHICPTFSTHLSHIQHTCITHSAHIHLITHLSHIHHPFIPHWPHLYPTLHRHNLSYRTHWITTYITLKPEFCSWYSPYITKGEETNKKQNSDQKAIQNKYIFFWIKTKIIITVDLVRLQKLHSQMLGYYSE